MMGSTIEVKSALGEGATMSVTLTLPISETAPPELEIKVTLTKPAGLAALKTTLSKWLQLVAPPAAGPDDPEDAQSSPVPNVPIMLQNWTRSL
jgi:hypothetical protein